MDRRLTITLHKELIEVFINCSNNPLDYNDFARLEGYLWGLFPHIALNDWMVIQFGLNVDYYGFKLDGIKSMKLQLFKNMWFQIYQKEKELIRIEAHGTVKNITFEQCLNLITRVALMVEGDRTPQVGK